MNVNFRITVESFFIKLFLAIVQGLTEFLPVSSSGHIAFFAHILRLKSDILNTTVIVHTGSVCALIITFFYELIEIVKGVSRKTSPYYNWLWYIIIATIPAALVGYIFESKFHKIFNSLNITGIAFITTGIILILTKFVRKPKKELNFVGALIIGIAQIMAIFPGISRAGITISSGLFLGLEKEKTYKFAFILGIPIILGASIFELSKYRFMCEDFLVFFVSLVVSIFAIKIVKKTLLRENFYKFGYYCIVLGILTNILNFSFLI